MRGERFREGGGIVQRLIFALCLPPTDSPLHLLRRLWKDIMLAQSVEQGIYDLRARGSIYGKLWLLHSVAPSLRSRVGVPLAGTPLSVNSRPLQATRKGWPYYIRSCHDSRRCIVGVPLAGTLTRVPWCGVTAPSPV